MQSALESAGINSNVFAPLITHKPKGVDAHYSSHDITELLIKFKSALAWLLPVTVEKVKSELDQTKQELTETEKKYEELEDKFVEKIDEKVGEAFKSIVKMMNEKGINAQYEESTAKDENEES